MTIQTNSWERVITEGAERSVAVLSGMLGQNLDVGALKVGRITLDEVSERAGGADQSLTVIYLAYWGDARGHMTLLLGEQVTSNLLGLLTGQPHVQAEPFNEIERSALGELGNIVASSFLNSISDATDLRLRPSPPDVVVDMVGAIVDVVAADVMDEDTEVYLVEVPFRGTRADIEGTFMVIPSSDLLTAITTATGAIR